MIAHIARFRRAAARTAVARVGVIATVALAGGMMLSAAATVPVRLLGVSSQGNAVVIEASEPVAYSVTRPDPLTLIVEMRNVTVGDVAGAAADGRPVRAITVQQARASDGREVAQVRVALTRAVEHRVRSVRNTIRVELTAATAGKQDTGSALPLPAEPVERERVTPTPSPRQPIERAVLEEPGITMEQALANARAFTPTDGPLPEAISALEKGPDRPAPRRAARETETPAAPRPVKLQKAPGQPMKAPVPPTVPAPQAATAAPLQKPEGAAPIASQQISGSQGKQYTGHPISMDFQGVDLRSVLRTFAEISGLNMVIDPDVQGTVDLVLTEVPWDQALQVILRGNGLDYTVDGTIVRIARVDTLRKEQDVRSALAAANANAGELVVRTYSLSYAKAEQAAPLIKSAILSQRGNVQIDGRTNTLIITDLAPRLDTVAQLLQTIDKPEPQVEIEARIITTTREFARAIGLQWGFNGRVAPELGNTTNLAFPNNGTLQGGLGDSTAVNLPITGEKAPNSAIGLALGAVNGAFNLDLALSALESSGKGRILSTPRITTQNNVEAEITQGVQIPIQVEANNTITVSYKDAALTLKVTPQITAANTVIMQITLENAQPGLIVPGGVSIDTQRAITRVQVSDGMTTVMGGIFVSREDTSNGRTPLLHRIPLLGWLFKNQQQLDSTRELLIFITPRILKG